MYVDAVYLLYLTCLLASLISELGLTTLARSTDLLPPSFSVSCSRYASLSLSLSLSPSPHPSHLTVLRNSSVRVNE